MIRSGALFLLALSPLAAADLLVAAASDMAPLAAALEAGYKKESGQRVRFTFASTGSLTQQIQNGAPYDVFLAADDKYVKDLAAGGHADPATITYYAFGRIGLWSADGSVRQLSDLSKPSVKHIAIANPQHAPYGAAARQALERQGLWKALEGKFVYGENVRQALQFAESGNADAVITSWTLLKGRGVMLPPEWYDPIRQAGAVVKSSAQPAAAKAFLGFLEGAGRDILEAGGLVPPPIPAIPPPAQKSPSKVKAKRVAR
jgi:molybdate transport system substrate-binding protein